MQQVLRNYEITWILHTATWPWQITLRKVVSSNICQLGPQTHRAFLCSQSTVTPLSSNSSLLLRNQQTSILILIRQQTVQISVKMTIVLLIQIWVDGMFSLALTWFSQWNQTEKLICFIIYHVSFKERIEGGINEKILLKIKIQI